MELMTYKTRALRTLSLLILVALIAALNPPSLTDSTAFAQATAPELTSSANTANQVDLSWTAVADADDYELWRWEEAEGWVELDDSISETSHTDSGVIAGKTYYYQVSADGGTTWSNRVNETVGAYDASTLAAPTATSTAISLSWGAVTGAASYELWRYENSWTQVGGTLTATTHSDTTVEIGKTYFYQVMAKGPNGDGAWSNRVSATVPTTTPGAPQNFDASPGNAEVMLSWNEPVSNGGSSITGYQYRYMMNGGTWTSWMATSPALSRTATVSNLTNESDYDFEVQALNANGAGAVAMASAMPMSTVPGTPMGLASPSAGPTEIQLSWNAVDGATGYQLQRRTNGGAWGSPMDAGSGTTYTDSDVMPSTTYDYEVRAVNAAGVSAWSAVATVSTTAPTAPDMPSLDAMASADKITLTWTMPAGNGAAITGYDLDVSDDGSSWDDLATKAAGDTSHEHMSLGPGTMKYYRIRAMNSIGNSDWSASAMATVAAVAPGKPTLYATASGTTIMLSWVAPAATGGADITRYTIQYSTTGTGGWSSLATKARDDTSHDHTGLAAGNTRYYRINATNSAGTGEWSDVASATIAGAEPPAGETPDNTSPRNLNVEADDFDATSPGVTVASITIEWDYPTSPPSDNDDGTTLTFEVEVWNDATQAWGLVKNLDTSDPPVDVVAEATLTPDAGTPADGVGTLTDTGLMGTTEYTYRVRAVDGTGTGAVNGKWSTQESATTVAVSPGKPMLTATKMGTGKIALSWRVDDDGGSDIIGYELQVADSVDADMNLESPQYLNAEGTAGTDAVKLEAAQQSVTHMEIAAGEEQFYRIRAVNGVVDPPTAAGTEDASRSMWSDPKSATTDMGPPSAPVLTDDPVDNTTAGSLVFTWAAPSDLGGVELSGITYELERLGDDGWVLVREDDTTTYTESELAGMVTRYYRVRAKSSNGAGPYAEASGTTLAGVPSAPKLSATVNGPDSITLSWTKPANGGSTITSYEIHVPDANGDYAITTDTELTTGLSGSNLPLTVTDTGLSPGRK